MINFFIENMRVSVYFLVTIAWLTLYVITFGLTYITKKTPGIVEEVLLVLFFTTLIIFGGCVWWLIFYYLKDFYLKAMPQVFMFLGFIITIWLYQPIIKRVYPNWGKPNKDRLYAYAPEDFKKWMKINKTLNLITNMIFLWITTIKAFPKNLILQICTKLKKISLLIHQKAKNFLVSFLICELLSCIGFITSCALSLIGLSVIFFCMMLLHIFGVILCLCITNTKVRMQMIALYIGLFLYFCFPIIIFKTLLGIVFLILWIIEHYDKTIAYPAIFLFVSGYFIYKYEYSNTTNIESSEK